MYKKLFIDFETRSTVDLRKVAGYNYAAHPGTEVVCMAYAFDEEEPQLLSQFQEVPEDVRHFAVNNGIFVAHNVNFEFLIWNFILTKRFNWPPLKFSQMSCTMARAYAMSYPGSLEDVAICLGLQEKKDKEGHRLMLQMCKPRKVKDEGTVIYWEDQDRLDRLYKYCKQDVRVTQEIDKYLLELSVEEKKLFILDGKINFRGVEVDIELTEVLQSAFEEEKLLCNGRIAEVTEGQVKTSTQVAAMVEWVNNKGVECDSVAKPAVIEMLTKQLPKDVREVLLLRQQTAKSSSAKAVSMKMYSNNKNRITASHQYHGASTGRWAGRGIQPQNFPRNEVSGEELDQLITDFKAHDTDIANAV